MDARLEQYLDEVAASLSPLPAKRRDEELREMRAHLQNAVLVHREFGQTEDEAARTAIEEFGPPQDLSAHVVRAWRRGEKKRQRRFWGAVALTPLILTSWFVGVSHLPNFTIPWLDPYCAQHKAFGEAFGRALWEGMSLTVFGLAGMAATRLSLTRPLRAVCLGLIFFFAGWSLQCGSLRLPTESWQFARWTLATILGAWAAGRTARVGRMRVAG